MNHKLNLDAAITIPELENLIAAGEYGRAFEKMQELDLDALVDSGHARTVVALRSALHPHLGDPRRSGLNANLLGTALSQVGELEAGLAHFAQAADRFREVGDPGLLAAALGNLGRNLK